MKKEKYPEVGELVIARIKYINPHSVFAHLKEYDKDGMIHISEIVSGWVKDIRKHVKKDQVVVARVIHVDKTKGHISLSLKRVTAKQAGNKLMEQKLEQKAEKMLDMVAEKIGNQSVKEKIKEKLKTNFGLVYHGLEKALKNRENIKRLGFPDEWVQAIVDVAKNNIQQKEFVFKANLSITSCEPNGVELIKKTVQQAEKMGLNVKFISSPNYVVSYKTKEAKKGSIKFNDCLKRLVKFGRENKTEVEFSMLE